MGLIEMDKMQEKSIYLIQNEETEIQQTGTFQIDQYYLWKRCILKI